MHTHKTLPTFAGILLLLAINPAGAVPITFNATGVSGIDGYIQFDDSTFSGTRADIIRNTQITDFYLSVFGSVFVLGDVFTASTTIIDSSGPSPRIVTSGGFLADNGFQTVALVPGGFVSPNDGDASLSIRPRFFSPFSPVRFFAVTWSVTPTATPMPPTVPIAMPTPATLWLFATGLVALTLLRKRRRSNYLPGLTQ